MVNLGTPVGRIGVFCRHNYDSVEMVDKVARMLDQFLGYFQFEGDSDGLGLLIVVEEAHLC
jgi:hypothetical protein